jgi:hypothetical protein
MKKEEGGGGEEKGRQLSEWPRGFPTDRERRQSLTREIEIFYPPWTGSSVLKPRVAQDRRNEAGSRCEREIKVREVHKVPEPAAVFSACPCVRPCVRPCARLSGKGSGSGSGEEDGPEEQ